MSDASEQARLVALFDDQSRSLRRLVSLFLVPVLLFGVLIFLPFSQQVDSQARIQVELEAARSDLDYASEAVSSIAAIDSLADFLRVPSRIRYEMDARISLWTDATHHNSIDSDLVRTWAEGSADVDLRTVPILTSISPEDMGASSCIWLDDRRWRDCFDLAEHGPCIGRGCVIYPDYSPNPGYATSGKLDEELARELVDALTAVDGAIRENAPSLAEIMRDRGDSFAFTDLVYPIWNQFEDTVSDRSRLARAEVERLDAEIVVLTARLERANRLIQGIELSGSAFETPLGPLPVGVRELVFLYPTILGLAYILCLSSFLRLASIRQALHDLSRKLNDSELATDPEHVALTMPLWYDPFLAAWRQAGRVILALVPLAFMVWCYVSLRSMSPVITNSDSRFNAQWYEVFLILTLAAAVAMLVRVIMLLTASKRTIRADAERSD